MEWNCPHCSTGLSVLDSKLGKTWSFARCYHCKNFTLINKNDPANTIRVDSPPESSEFDEKPVIRPVDRKDAATESVSPPEQNMPDTPEPERGLQGAGFPEPLPEIPEDAPASRWMPYVSTVAAIFIVIAGGIIYMSADQGLSPNPESREDQIKPIGRFVPIEEPIRAGQAMVTEPAAPQVNNAGSSQAAGFQYTETVVTSKGASAQENAQEKKEPGEDKKFPATVYVHAKASGTPFYGGPGLAFPVLGVLNPDLKYSIAETKNEWFKIENEESKVVYGWIRNTTVDFVAVGKNTRENSQTQ